MSDIRLQAVVDSQIISRFPFKCIYNAEVAYEGKHYVIGSYSSREEGMKHAEDYVVKIKHDFNQVVAKHLGSFKIAKN